MVAKKTVKKKAVKKSVSKKIITTQELAGESIQTGVKNVQASAWGYNPLNMLSEFLKYEASGGLLLLFFATLAMIVANSPLGDTYYHILHNTNLTIKVGNFGLDKDIIHWINDGLMAIFFFLVGLEIKREMMEGALASVKQALLPAIAAVGGMVIPGLVYIYFNMYDAMGVVDFSNDKIPGWAVPTATDIAFAVGMMTLLGKRVPLALKVFLLALAIFDDLGAILIIAFFYTSNLDVSTLTYAAFFVGILILFNRLNVTRGTWYLIAGVALWFCVLKSGVHATLAGVAIALAIPLEVPGERRSLLRQLEHDLHPFVAFFVLPLFAFANAGVSLEGISIDNIFNTITVGIVCALFFGKQVGVFVFTWLSHTLRIARLPEGITWWQIWGVSALAGIGFTMSLFVASLGFKGNELLLNEAKLGILIGSAMSAIIGTYLLYVFGHKPKKK